MLDTSASSGAQRHHGCALRIEAGVCRQRGRLPATLEADNARRESQHQRTRVVFERVACMHIVAAGGCVRRGCAIGSCSSWRVFTLRLPCRRAR